MAVSSVSGSSGQLTGLITKSQLERLDELEKDEKSNELKKKQQMNQEQFLFLITEQLKNQDPLSPMKDEQFIAQMAQLQSLESTNNLVKMTQANMTALTSIKTSMESMNTNIQELVKLVKGNTTPVKPASNDTTPPTTSGPTPQGPTNNDIVNELIKMNKAMEEYFKK